LEKEDDKDNRKNSKTDQSTDPQRRQHPNPGPSNVTSEFQTDEENSQQTRETDTAGGRGGVA